VFIHDQRAYLAVDVLDGPSGILRIVGSFRIAARLAGATLNFIGFTVVERVELS